MYFITIKNQTGETVAINPKRITSITNYHGHVIICLGSQENIYTQFTSIDAAVQYVELAYKDRLKTINGTNWKGEDDL
jgi:hypothetical protein|tara:strand:+ start:1700 stop:1933 length:234 start_codon:yes stop_codon:yes gene_type:complete